MAISIEQAPFGWTARGQKIVYRVGSDATANINFKYGVTVTVSSSGKVYSFLFDPNPNDLKLYFDMTTLVQLQNMETESEGGLAHYQAVETLLNEVIGKGYEVYTVVFSEWYSVAGSLTQAGAVTAPNAFNAFNASLQAFYGFRPNPETSSEPTKFTLNDIKSFAWSNRWLNTSSKPSALNSFLFALKDTVFIPAYNSDYGAIALQCGTAVMATNGAAVASFLLDTGSGVVTWDIALGSRVFAHLGCYPMNLNDSADPSVGKPNTYPNWKWYSLNFKTVATVQKSVQYVFYNADKYGQHDCRYDKVRLGWVSTRGGWDYFTFIKRNEFTNNLQRKQYTRILEDGTSQIFDPSQRQYVNRNVAVERTLLLTSDWIEENEFIYLRNLFASQQIVMLVDPTVYPITYAPAKQITVPVSIEENSFVEQRGRNGKLVNVSLRIKVAQDFWT